MAELNAHFVELDLYLGYGAMEAIVAQYYAVFVGVYLVRQRHSEGDIAEIESGNLHHLVVRQGPKPRDTGLHQFITLTCHPLQRRVGSC